MLNSYISLTNNTFNFWIGCRKLSPGCKFCYMHRMYDNKGIDPNIVGRTGDATFKQALRWKEPKMIFTNSMSDFFIEDADQWRDDAWEEIRNAPHHQWQCLTKSIIKWIQNLVDQIKSLGIGINKATWYFPSLKTGFEGSNAF